MSDLRIAFRRLIFFTLVIELTEMTQARAAGVSMDISRSLQPGCILTGKQLYGRSCFLSTRTSLISQRDQWIYLRCSTCRHEAGQEGNHNQRSRYNYKRNWISLSNTKQERRHNFGQR